MPLLIDKKNKILIYLIFLLLLSTSSNKFTEKHNKSLFIIDKIEVIGLSENNNSLIMNKINQIIYKNIFFISKKKINEIIEEHSIIDEYKIKKIYPKKIIIDIKPTTFVAKISGKSQLLVGSNGKIIKNEKSKETLPYLFGEFDTKKFLMFKKNIDQSEFEFKNIKSIYFYSSNRQDILTKDNVLVKLPGENQSKSLSIAYKIMKDSNFKDNKLIDLRIKNHVVIK